MMKNNYFISTAVSFLTELVENFDREKGTNHNWMSLYSKFNKPDVIEHWAKIFTFDTLIGNTDRHQDNWGIITLLIIRRFSPAFDNGTALGYEIKEERLKSYISNGNKLAKYLSNGRHHMKWSLGEGDLDNFFTFMEKFVMQNPDIKYIISECLDFCREEIEEAILPLCDLIDDGRYKLTHTRVEFTINLIMERKRLLEKTLEL